MVIACLFLCYLVLTLTSFLNSLLNVTLICQLHTNPSVYLDVNSVVHWASLVAQVVIKHLLAMQEIWVQSLGQEDPLEKEMATPVFLPGESHAQKSLVGYNPWGCRVRHD